MDVNEQLKNYTDNIAYHLQTALHLALQMQGAVAHTEGDSELLRKLSHYLVPNLVLWTEGAQAGNVKDLRECLARREVELAVKAKSLAKQGDGHEVLTAPVKE